MKPSTEIPSPSLPAVAGIGAAVSVPLSLGLANMLSAFVFVTPPPFFPAMSRALGVSVPMLGQVMTALLFIAATLSLFIGPLADRHGLRRLLIVGAIAATICMLGFGVAPSYPALLLAAAVGGLASATIPGLTLAIARTTLEGPARQRGIGWANAGAAASAIAAVPLMTVISGTAGWRGAFIAAAILAAGVTAFLAWFLPADRPLPDPCAGPRTLLGAYAPLLRHRPTLRVYATTVLRSVSYFGLLSYSGSFLGNQLDIEPRWVGIIYMLTGTAYFTGSLTAGRVLAWLSPRTLMTGTNIALGVTIAVVFGAVDGIMGAMALLPLASLLGAFSNIGTVTLLSTEAPGGSGTVMVLNGALTNLGAAGGGALGGMLLASGGYPALGIGLAAFALSTVMVVGRTESPRATPAPLRPA